MSLQQVQTSKTSTVGSLAPMSIYTEARCVCNRLQCGLTLRSLDDARTSLCHCSSCNRALGTNFGLTTKVPVQTFKYIKGTPKSHTQENGVTREFCDTCGVFLCEYGEQAADKFRYIFWGTIDDLDKFPPKGEFFCSCRKSWMPEIPNVFHKEKIKT